MAKNLKLDPFADDEPTYESVMTPLMGIASPLDQLPRNVVARPVSITALERDPRQPRRAIPSAAMLGWDGRTAGIPGVLERWYMLATEQSGGSLDLSAYLVGEAPPSVEDGPIAEGFISLLHLARSILDQGLDNPILVADGWIESGERRWLAYHLLQAFSHDEQWSRIPARDVGHGSVWRQAGENGARENLNAISLARQLALLIMDLYTSMGVEFRAYDIAPGLCDQPFYAQVADGDEYRVPPGAKDRLLAVMGLKNAVQLRQYRALLRLPPEIWLQADDENWPETRLRQFIKNLNPNRVTPVTRAPSLKITSDLAPRWGRVKEIVLSRRPSATDQSILAELIEFFIASQHVGGGERR